MADISKAIKVARQALGRASEARPITSQYGSFSGSKLPDADKLARLKDKFIYHSSTADQLENMRWGLEPQHGPWINEMAQHAGDIEPEELLRRSVPLVWMSDTPSWVSAKVARKLNKHVSDVTEQEIRGHGHLAMIPKKGEHAEHVWRVGDEGLSEGEYSTVTNLRGEPRKAYQTDLYDSDYGQKREPFGVERNEYISAQPVEPMFNLTGQDLVDFLNAAKRDGYAGGGVIEKALKVVRELNPLGLFSRTPVEGANPAVEPQTTEPREGFQGGGRTEMTPEEYNRALEMAKDVLRQQLRKQIDAANGGFDPAVPIDWQLSRPKITDRVPPQRVVARSVAPMAYAPVAPAAPAAPAAAPMAYAPVAPAAEAPAAPIAARQQGPVERAMAVVRSVPQAVYEVVSSPVATAQNIAREIFSGNNYQSTGEPIMSDGRINWGDPESAADFFRADKALQEMGPYREDQGFDKGGSAIKKTIQLSRRVLGYSDPPSKKIDDWKWRPLSNVAAELDVQKIPPHVQKFGDYMREMVDKAKRGEISDRDLIKAYTTTRASIQRRSQDTDKIREASGLPLVKAEDKIRPEGAWAEWLMSPAGQRYLDKAVKGEMPEDTVESALSLMRSFGLAPTQISAMDWAAKNLPGRSQAASDLVYRAGQMDSPVSEWRNFTSDVAGVGSAKSGFLASLLGRGDLPTLDARQIILNTGLPTEASQKIMARSYQGQKGFGAQEGVDRLAARQEALGLEAPAKYDPFYQHLAHHTIWDKASNEKTTHADIINAMRNAAIVLGIPAAGAAVMPEEQPVKRAAGGRLLEDEYPTQYLPDVGRQVMADGGEIQDKDYFSQLYESKKLFDRPLPSLSYNTDREGISVEPARENLFQKHYEEMKGSKRPYVSGKTTMPFLGGNLSFQGSYMPERGVPKKSFGAELEYKFADGGRAIDVARQVMADGGDTMAGFMPPSPDETPDDRGERWQAALRNYRNFPVRPGEATLQPADITARDYIAQAIAGEGGPSYGSELRKRAANLLVGSRGLPDTGIGFGLADAPMVTGIPLQALDIADATRRGNYGEAALGAALPVAFWARKPIISAGRRAVEVAGDVLGRVPAPVAAGAAGAAAMTPSEAEAGKFEPIRRLLSIGMKPSEIEKALQIAKERIPANHPKVMWHGTPSGDLRGGASGLHLGTFEAARQALNARIGIPAQGEWTGLRVYGETPLAGKNTILSRNKYGLTGNNVYAPDEDYLPTRILKYANGQEMPMTVEPVIYPFRIVGPMSNWFYLPMSDMRANAKMKEMLTKQQARRGYYYKNEVEDAGSISVAVPGGRHVEPIDLERLLTTGQYANGGSVSHRAMMIAKELGSSPRETVTS